MNGLILVDKPSGCTSHDVVNRWRRLARTKRVGHLGTLDPMATGLLALVSGNATRLAQFFGKEDKTYEAEIRLGAVSDTYDADGEVKETNAAIPGKDAIEAALRSFAGVQWQTPPPVSAKKVNGVPAYKLARRNEAVELKPVEVEFKEVRVQEITGERVSVRVTSSSGTYIRSLAHDLGKMLGCGALLNRLRRICIGNFDVRQARTMEELQALAEGERLQEAVMPTAMLLPQVPAEHFDDTAELFIRQGRDFRTSPFVVPPGSPFVKALSASGELIAIGELKIPNFYHPRTVL